MRAVPNKMAAWLWLWLPLAFLLLSGCSPDPGRQGAKTETYVPDWEVIWDQQAATAGTPAEIKDQPGWKSWQDSRFAEKGRQVETAWLRTRLPTFDWRQPALLLREVEGLGVQVFFEEKPVYDIRRDYRYKNHQIFLPAHPEDGGKMLYLRIESPGPSFGLEGSLELGEYETLRGRFIRLDLNDFVMGGSILLITTVMLCCLIFLPRHFKALWLSLSAVIGSSGILLITYSPFLYTFYGEYGELWFIMFDLALFILFPALTFYFEKINGPGPYGILRKFRIFQVLYSAGCVVFMIVNMLSGYRYHEAYYLMTAKILGLIIIFQLLLLIGVTASNLFRRNREAYIFAAGFGFLAAAGLGDLISFYALDGEYHFYLWNWGVLGFIASLIVMIGLKFMRSHEQVVRYSRELELFNNELQRSEKMEIISELAASVAHEVRNPLQVTRGFMQLLSQKSNNPIQQDYLNLALKELDRASNIITDFLTFAKPELEQISILNLSEELRHVAGILNPLASLEGSEIQVNVSSDLYVKGNSSKLKQAMINLVKNSIEALDGEGTVNIRTLSDRGRAVISIQDNGVGMDMGELARLGEPYFSNKTKGTGLGLMVTFRIIEAMDGKIDFTSQKGIGTEVIITLPLVEPPPEAPAPDSPEPVPPHQD